MAPKDEDSFIKKIEADFKNAQDREIADENRTKPFPEAQSPKSRERKDTSDKISRVSSNQDPVRHKPADSENNQIEPPPVRSGKMIKRVVKFLGTMLLIFLILKFVIPFYEGKTSKSSSADGNPSTSAGKNTDYNPGNTKTEMDDGKREVPAQLISAYKEAAASRGHEWNPGDIKVIWLDLNGDGVMDPITQGGRDYCGSCGCSHDIFISRKGELLAAGWIECAAKHILRSDAMTNGYYDSVVNGRTTYHFNGKEYVMKSSVPELKSAQLPAISERIEHDIHFMLNDYLTAAEKQDLDYVLSFYGDQVDYYESGVVNKGFIREDKSAYFKKWSEIKSAIVGEPKINLHADGIFVVNFKTRWMVRNDRQTVSGTADNTWKLRDTNGGLKIIHEKQTVTSKNN